MTRVGVVSLLLVAGLVSLPAGPSAGADGFVGTAPSRLLDTRTGAVTVDGLMRGGGFVGPGQTVRVPIAGRAGVPTTGVTAVAINVTATEPTAESYVTVFPTGGTVPTTSTLNPTPGPTVANLAVVGLGADGSISVYNRSGQVHLIVDLAGWYASGFTGITPTRLIDTRPAGAIGPSSTLRLQVGGHAGVPLSGVTAVAVNVSATGATADSFLTVYPTTRPIASNLNSSPGRTNPNLVIVPLAADGTVTIFNADGHVQLIVDVLGWFTGGYTGLSPTRVLDTRNGGATIDGRASGLGAVTAKSTVLVPIAGRGAVPGTGVHAVAVNITATETTATTFVTAYPTTRPLASNMNPSPRRTTTNMAIVPLASDGSITLYNDSGSTHLIVDVLGWFADEPPTPPTVPSGQHPRIYLPANAARLNELSATGRPAATRFRSLIDARMGTPNASLIGSEYRMWYFALLGQLTGMASYCTKAVAGIDEFVAREEGLVAGGSRPEVAYDSYLDVGPIIGDVALVYDWCYSSTTAAQRLRWLAYADQAVWNVWHHETAAWGGRSYPWTGWSVDNPSNNYYYSFLRATMMLGLAANGELPNATTWLETFRTAKIGQQLIPTFNRDLVGGGSREGTGYGTAMMRLWELYDWWKASTGEDLAALTPHTRASLLNFIHYTVPTLNAVSLNGDHSRDSTGSFFDYHRHYAQSLAFLLPGDPLAAKAKFLIDNSSVPAMGQGWMAIYDFLYDQPSVTPQPLAGLNTAYFAAGIGQLYSRSDWSASATWLNMTAGPYTESHAHRDQGSFMLFKNGWAAYDPNYHSHSGIEQDEDLHNLVNIRDAGGTVVRQYEGESSQVVALQQGDGWLHVAVDATDVYQVHGSPPVSRVQRELLSIGPDVMVVFDRVTSAMGTSQTWQLNSPGQPVIAGATATMTNGSTTLTSRRIIPVTATTSTHQWSTNAEFSGGYRLDERASGSANTWLHVLSFGSAATTAERDDSAGRQGVRVSLADGRVVTARFSASAVDGTLEIRTAGGTLLQTASLNSGVRTLVE